MPILIIPLSLFIFKFTSLVKKTPLLKDLNPNETEDQTIERQRKQILYEQNWDAQEQANRIHRKTLNLVADEMHKHGLQPKYNVIDVLVENANRILIFEIKSIHTENFTSQTRKAIGQLLDYKYFQIKSKIANFDKKILRGIVYSKKPPKKSLSF